MGNRKRKAEYRKWSIKCRKLKRKTENGKQKTRMKSYQTLNWCKNRKLKTGNGNQKKMKKTETRKLKNKEQIMKKENRKRKTENKDESYESSHRKDNFYIIE